MATTKCNRTIDLSLSSSPKTIDETDKAFIYPSSTSTSTSLSQYTSTSSCSTSSIQSSTGIGSLTFVFNPSTRRGNRVDCEDGPHSVSERKGQLITPMPSSPPSIPSKHVFRYSQNVPSSTDNKHPVRSNDSIPFNEQSKNQNPSHLYMNIG